MQNKEYAKEWLRFAYRNLYTARRLYDVDHFTDIIVVDLQQSIEKVLNHFWLTGTKRFPNLTILMNLHL